MNEEEKEALLSDVITQIKKDFESQDESAVWEMLSFLPENILKGYLPDE